MHVGKIAYKHMATDFISTNDKRGEWNDIFKDLRGDNFEHRLLYLKKSITVIWSKQNDSIFMDIEIKEYNL